MSVEKCGKENMPFSRPGSSRPRVICAALRHARRGLCQRIVHAAAAPDDGFARCYVSVIGAVEAGFRHEEIIMETLGYVHLHAHRAENAVVLSALHRIVPDVEGGDCALGRQVLTALLDVLELHRLNADLAVTLAVTSAVTGATTSAVANLRGRRAAQGKAARIAAHCTTWRHHGR
jgi:hemerythrin